MIKINYISMAAEELPQSVETTISEIFPKILTKSPSQKKWTLLRNLVKPFQQPPKEPIPPAEVITSVEEATRMVEQDPYKISHVRPDIITREMIETVYRKDPLHLIHVNLYDFNFFADLLEQYPGIMKHTQVEPGMTMRLWFTTRIVTRYYEQDVIELLSRTDTVCLNVLCHGGLLDEFYPPIVIDRYSSIPLGVCEFMSSMECIDIHDSVNFESVEGFIESSHECMMKQITKSTSHNEKGAKRNEALKGITKPILKQYSPGDDFGIMNKVYSNASDVTKYPIAYLDIGGGYPAPIGKNEKSIDDKESTNRRYNLFRFKPMWTLDEIITTFCQGKKLIIMDYSCSNMENMEERMRLLGGTKRTRRKKRPTKRMKRYA